MITGKSVLNASDAMDELTEKQLAERLESFVNAQPDIVRFVQLQTRNAGVLIQELVLVQSYFIFTAYETEHPDKTITVRRKDIDVALDQVGPWIDHFNAGTLDIETEPQPYLLIYIHDQIKPPLADGTNLSRDEWSLILLTLKTVISAFDLASRRLSAR